MSQTRCSRESLQLVVNGDLVQVAPVVPHLEPAELFWSTFGYTLLDIQDPPEVGAHVSQEHGQLCLHSHAGHQLTIIIFAFEDYPHDILIIETFDLLYNSLFLPCLVFGPHSVICSSTARNSIHAFL